MQPGWKQGTVLFCGTHCYFWRMAVQTHPLCHNLTDSTPTALLQMLSSLLWDVSWLMVTTSVSKLIKAWANKTGNGVISSSQHGLVKAPETHKSGCQASNSGQSILKLGRTYRGVCPFPGHHPPGRNFYSKSTGPKCKWVFRTIFFCFGSRSNAVLVTLLNFNSVRPFTGIAMNLFEGSCPKGGCFREP